MSTNSRIGVLLADNKVQSIYCHGDGYPSYNGKLLLGHWTNPDDINELIALGDLSALGSCIGEKHDFDTHSGTFEFDRTTGRSTRTPSEAQEKGWCLFYCRDRGEGNVAPQTHDFTDWPDSGQEFEYLFDPKQGWLYRPIQFGTKTKDVFEPLTEYACIDEDDWQAA